MSAINPPRRGLRGLGQTAALGGRLRADRAEAAHHPRPLSLKAVRRETDKRRPRTP